jgi:hypothetical protein
MIGRSACETAIDLLGRELWPVATRHGQKRPITKSWGIKQATREWLEQIYGQHTDAGVGVCLGPGRGPGSTWLIDIEVDAPDAEASMIAEASLTRLFSGEPTKTMSWMSNRGSHRLYLVDGERLLGLLAAAGATEGKRGQPGTYHLAVFPGLEFRVGGYKPDGTVKQIQSIVPPTPGTDGQPRQWIDAEPIAELPDSVYATLETIAERAAITEEAQARQDHGRVTGGTLKKSTPHPRRDAYVRKALDSECQAVTSAPDGVQNATLFNAAISHGQFVGAGVLDRSEAEQRLLDTAADYARKDGEAQARATIQSGLNRGVSEPRDLSHLQSDRNGASTSTAVPESNQPENDQETQAQILLRLASHAELWRTPDQRAYASFTINGHLEHHEVKSPGMRRWLTRAFYSEQGKPASSEAMQGALGVLEAQAIYDGLEHPVFVRCAELDGALYLDLCDDGWRAVEITIDGWSVVTNPPVRFRRPAGLLALPEPLHGGSLDLLRKHVNVEDAEFVLLGMWLVAALRSRGPYPILALTGEQGSAKSTLARVARRLVDPHVCMLRYEPRNPHDLMISATNSWAVAFDNLSAVHPWLSEGLCCLATGGGYATRTLYSNQEETFLDAMRPAILNGITDYVSRPDLIDRCLFLHLPRIEESERKPEREFWQAFDADYPFILGALLDAVAGALRLMPTIRPPKLSRMADFEQWAQAACQALGWNANHFAAAYAANRRNAHETILEDSPVAAAVRQLVERFRSWTGTPTELLGELAALVGEKVVATPRWPKSPRSLTGTLRRLAPTLRHVGIESRYVPHTRKGGQWTLAEKEGDDPSPASHASPQPDFQGQVVTDRNGEASPTASSVTDPSPTLPGKTLGRDACDGRDGRIPTLSGGFESEWEEGDV